MDGFLLIDKISGVTSFDVIKNIRKLTGQKKVGHSGTLDPLASGLLIIALGKATKLLEYLIGCDKAYEVIAKFGEVSDTYDAEGCIKKVNTDEACLAKILKGEFLKQEITNNFLGEILQMPPVYSALKIKGKRACDIVRAGGEVQLSPRNVKINNFQILSCKSPLVRFLVECGSGTYVRSLIHDLGMKLGLGAYVQELRRTKIHTFSVDQAVLFDGLNTKFEQGFISIDDIVTAFPVYKLSVQEYEGLKNGKYMSLNYSFPEGQNFIFAVLGGEYKGVLQYNPRRGFKLKKTLN